MSKYSVLLFTMLSVVGIVYATICALSIGAFVPNGFTWMLGSLLFCLPYMLGILTFEQLKGELSKRARIWLIVLVMGFGITFLVVGVSYMERQFKLQKSLKVLHVTTIH